MGKWSHNLKKSFFAPLNPDGTYSKSPPVEGDFLVGGMDYKSLSVGDAWRGKLFTLGTEILDGKPYVLLTADGAQYLKWKMDHGEIDSAVNN